MNAKPPRRSIVANFGALSTASVPDSETARPAPFPAPRVAAGVIGATQRTLSDIREERDRLQALVETGDAGAAEIDPALVDPSPFPDRLADDDDLTFEAFKKSFAEEGQQIPIQVRRHPSGEGRYQVIYGHRRLRAAKDLGRPVRALIRDLSDRELVVAQGIENGERQDLTWIERALFASRMEGAGIRARDIRAALSLDDPELARMRLVWKTLPADVIGLIGRAPKIGRPRWIELATTAGREKGVLAAIRRTLSADKVSALPSNDRFLAVLAAVQRQPKGEGAKVDMLAPSGERLGAASFGANGVRLTVERAHAKDFAAFMEAELPGLVARFIARREGADQ